MKRNDYVTNNLVLHMQFGGGKVLQNNFYTQFWDEH